MQLENKASFVLLASLFLSCYLTYFEFQIIVKGQVLRFLCLEVAAKFLFGIIISFYRLRFQACGGK